MDTGKKTPGGAGTPVQHTKNEFVTGFTQYSFEDHKPSPG